MENTKFNIHEIPKAYFSENEKSKELIKDLVKHQVGISECTSSDLETIFFSDENMNLINNQLIKSVYTNTNNTIRISKQSPEKLIIAMRYVYIQYAKNLAYDIYPQVNELNCRVLNEILPDVITNATQKITYLESLTSERKLLPLPENVRNSKLLRGSATVIIDR